MKFIKPLLIATATIGFGVLGLAWIGNAAASTPTTCVPGYADEGPVCDLTSTTSSNETTTSVAPSTTAPITVAPSTTVAGCVKADGTETSCDMATTVPTVTVALACGDTKVDGTILECPTANVPRETLPANVLPSTGGSIAVPVSIAIGSTVAGLILLIHRARRRAVLDVEVDV